MLHIAEDMVVDISCWYEALMEGSMYIHVLLCVCVCVCVCGDEKKFSIHTDGMLIVACCQTQYYMYMYHLSAGEIATTQ